MDAVGPDAQPTAITLVQQEILQVHKRYSQQINPSFVRLACKTIDPYEADVIHYLNERGFWAFLMWKIPSILLVLLAGIIIATTVKDSTRMLLIFFVVTVVPGMFILTGVRKAFRAKLALDSLMLKMERVLKELHASVSLNESTEAVYSVLVAGFVKKTSWVKYWQSKDDKTRASALETELSALLTEAIPLFGLFESNQGNQAFLSHPDSDKVVVKIKELTPVLHLTLVELRPLSNKTITVQEFAKEIIGVRGAMESSIVLLRLIHMLVSEADCKSPLGAIIGNEINELLPREFEETRQAVVTHLMA